ncbi:MAG: hypothetical protein ACKOW1_04465 [Novosphingobium sp.]|jgi:hypothetical protein
MNFSVSIGLALLAATTPENSYKVETTITKSYNSAPYSEITLKCKAGLLVYTATVDSAPAGFGMTDYFVNEIPFETRNGYTILKTQGVYTTFDAAAKKACFG